MYEIVYTNRMKRDAKLMKKRGRNLEKLVEVLNLLASGNPLPQKYKDHQLTGNLNDFRECHIEPDWLLMYQIFENELIRVESTGRDYDFIVTIENKTDKKIRVHYKDMDLLDTYREGKLEASDVLWEKCATKFRELGLEIKS